MGARGRSERARGEKRRQQKPTILVIVEGETELGYFSHVKSRLRAKWITVEKPHCNDSRGLVRAAVMEKRAHEREGLDVHAWVVFDAESRECEGERGYQAAMAEAQRKDVRIANSSPCFEYWLLLHFLPGAQPQTPSEAVGALRRGGGIAGYEKPNLPHDDLWGIFATGKPTAAAEDRRKLIESLREDPRVARPVTYVDQLMGEICEVAGIDVGPSTKRARP